MARPPADPRFRPLGGGRYEVRETGEQIGRREFQKRVGRPLPPRPETAQTRARETSKRTGIEWSSNRKDASLYVHGVKQTDVAGHPNRKHATTVPDDGTELPQDTMLMAGPDDGESRTQGTTLVAPGGIAIHASAEWQLPCSETADCCKISGWVPALSAFLVDQLHFEAIIAEHEWSNSENDCIVEEYDENEADNNLQIYGYWERLPRAPRQKQSRKGKGPARSR